MSKRKKDRRFRLEVSIGRSKEKCQELLAELIPFDQWIVLTNPSEQFQRYYWMVVTELEKGAGDGFPIEIIFHDSIIH